MNAASKYPTPFRIIQRAQKRYPGGDLLEGERFDSEIDEILHAVGLIPSGDPEEEYFLELTDPHVRRNRRTQVELDHVFLDATVPNENPPRQRGRPRKVGLLEYSDRFIANNLERLRADLVRVKKVRRPLHSEYCRGAVRSLLNAAIREHCPEVLRRKGAGGAEDVIGHLRGERFRERDHQQIRDLIDKILLPELSGRADRFGPARGRPADRLPTPMAWRQTLLLEFDSLYRRYAPHKEGAYSDIIPPSETGTTSFFIKFVCAVIEPLVKDDAADPDAINTQWRAIRKIMTQK